MAYANFTDCEKFLEGFGTNYFGTYNETLGSLQINTIGWQDAINSSFNNVNTILDSFQKIPIIPVGTQPRTGSYHSALVELNVCDMIFNKLKARHIQEFGGKLPDWMMYFGSRCSQIFDDIVNDKITFSTDTVRTGIGIPVKVTTNGFATFFSNWDFGFYSASDYPKTFRFKVTGTSDGNGLGQAKFRISEDDGISYQTNDNIVGSSWICIKNGLEIRWQAGTTTGTQVQFELNDEWKVDCTPTQIRTSSYKSTFSRFGRG